MHNPLCELHTKLQRKTFNRDYKVEINKGQSKCIVEPNKVHKDKKIHKINVIYTHT